jgi:hypothetical protein
VQYAAAIDVELIGFEVFDFFGVLEEFEEFEDSDKNSEDRDVLEAELLVKEPRAAFEEFCMARISSAIAWRSLSLAGGSIRYAATGSGLEMPMELESLLQV